MAQTYPPASLSPAAPTTSDVITSSYTVPGGCGYSEATTISGTVIRTVVTLHGCITGPHPPDFPYGSMFGPLPVGTYTYEIYLDWGPGFDLELRSRQQFVVSVAAIPAMTTEVFALLIGTLVLAAFAAMEGVSRR